MPSPASYAAAIDAIAGLPDRMRAAVVDLTDDQLDISGRRLDGGQVVATSPTVT
jgi:hypothetical protein